MFFEEKNVYNHRKHLCDDYNDTVCTIMKLFDHTGYSKSVEYTISLDTTFRQNLGTKKNDLKLNIHFKTPCYSLI